VSAPIYFTDSTYLLQIGVINIRITFVTYAYLGEMSAGQRGILTLSHSIPHKITVLKQ